jgi:hypothetical protein
MKGQKESKATKQFGLCAHWTHDGNDFPSGNLDLRTGQTPHDNFICTRCQREAKTNSFVRQQIERIAA